MGTFSEDMRTVAADLIKELGNSCTLERVIKGEYNPSTGKTAETVQSFETYSAPVSINPLLMGLDGINTNLSGFNTNKIIVAWFGYELDATWRYNGHNILSVVPTRTQDDVVIYTLEIGEE